MPAPLLTQTITIRDPRSAPITTADMTGSPSYIEIVPWTTILRYEGRVRGDLVVMVRYTQPLRVTPSGPFAPWITDPQVRLPAAVGAQDVGAWSRRIETEVVAGHGVGAFRYIVTGAEHRIRLSADSVTVRCRLTHHVRFSGLGTVPSGLLDPMSQPWVPPIPDITATASVAESAHGVTEDSLIYTDTVSAFIVGAYVSPIPPWARRVRVASASTTTVMVVDQRSFLTAAAPGQSVRSSASQAVGPHDTNADQLLVAPATHIVCQYTSGGLPQILTFTYSGRAMA